MKFNWYTLSLLPSFLRKKELPPAPTVEPKKPIDTSFMTAIDQSILINRLIAVYITEMDCTDKTIYYFLCEWLGNDKTMRTLVNDMNAGLIVPDFTMDDMAIFFRNHIIK